MTTAAGFMRGRYCFASGAAHFAAATLRVERATAGPASIIYQYLPQVVARLYYARLLF